MSKPIYKFELSATKKDIELTNSILNDEQITESNIEDITNKILSLDFIQQLIVIHCILDTIYEYDEVINNKSFVGKLLSKKCFYDHRRILSLCLTDDDYIESTKDDITKYENKYNIEIKY